MAGEEGIVEIIEGIAEAAGARSVAPGERLLTITFAGGRIGILDLSKPTPTVWAQVLRSIHQMGNPAYVEIDPRTRHITRLLQPTLQPVGEIRQLERGRDVQVELLDSHAIHFLRGQHPRFQELLKRLRSARRRKARVWVTETLDSHDIIDVRAVPAGKS